MPSCISWLNIWELFIDNLSSSTSTTTLYSCIPEESVLSLNIVELYPLFNGIAFSSYRLPSQYNLTYDLTLILDWIVT